MQFKRWLRLQPNLLKCNMYALYFYVTLGSQAMYNPRWRQLRCTKVLKTWWWLGHAGCIYHAFPNVWDIVLKFWSLYSPQKLGVGEMGKINADLGQMGNKGNDLEANDPPTPPHPPASHQHTAYISALVHLNFLWWFVHKMKKSILGQTYKGSHGSWKYCMDAHDRCEWALVDILKTARASFSCQTHMILLKMFTSV